MFNQKKYKHTYYLKNKEKINSKNKKYYEDHKEEMLSQQKEYYQRNKQKISVESKKYYKENREEKLNYQKEYQKKHKKEHNKICREYYLKHKIQCKQTARTYREKNKLQIKKRSREYNQRFYTKLVHSLRERVRSTLKGNYKSATTLKLVGCSLEFLKSYLQKQFKPGMTWDNWGKYGWHIDHIKSCKSFDLSKPSEQRKCFNYTNLQPLWAEENLSKGVKC